MNPVSIGATISASFRFVGVAWTRAWGILLLWVWLAAIVQAIQLARPELTPLTWLIDILAIFVSTAAIGAFYRVGVESDHPGDLAYAVGPSGFNWGNLEWRVLLANIVVAVIIGVLLFFAILIWAVVFGVSAAASGATAQGLEAAPGSAAQMAAFYHLMLGPAGVVSVIIAIPFLIGLLFLGAKLALFAVTVADTGKLAFGEAWALTKGALGPLIVTTVVDFLAQTAVVQAVAFIAGVLAGALGQGPQGGLWGGVAGQIVAVSINGPLVAGMQIYVYRAKRGDAGVAQTFA